MTTKNASVQAKAYVISRCPIVWEDENSEFISFASRLLDCWVRTGASLEVDGEGAWFTIEKSDIHLVSEEDAERDFANLKCWIEEAREDYKARTRHFVEIYMADENLYGKHYPRGKPLEAIREYSLKTNISLLRPGLRAAQLLDALWEALSDIANEQNPELFWDRLFRERILRIAFEAPTVVGFSKGTPTNFIAFQLDSSSAPVHCFPVSAEEARGMMPEFSALPSLRIIPRTGAGSRGGRQRTWGHERKGLPPGESKNRPSRRSHHF